MRTNGPKFLLDVVRSDPRLQEELKLLKHCFTVSTITLCLMFSEDMKDQGCFFFFLGGRQEDSESESREQN